MILNTGKKVYDNFNRKHGYVTAFDTETATLRYPDGTKRTVYRPDLRDAKSLHALWVVGFFVIYAAFSAYVVSQLI